MDQVKQSDNLPPQNYRYKCPYLAVLIFDLIQTVLAGIGVLLLLFVTGYIKVLVEGKEENYVSVLDSPDSNGTIEIEFSSNGSTGSEGSVAPKEVEMSAGTIWGIRVFLVVILCILITIQYFGWKGYKKYHFKSVIIFAVFKGLGAMSALVKVCAAFNFPTLVGLLFNVLVTVIPVMFAMEIRKRKIYGVTTAQP